MNRWIVLIAACLINLFSGSIYAWSVFAPAKAAQLSQVLHEVLGPQDLAIMFSMANAMCPMTMILGGMITDNFGVKKVLFLGGAFICFGLIYSGLSETFIELFIAYGIFFGLGIGLVYGSVIGNTIKYFPDRRGLVAGLTSASYGVCSVFLPPLANFCIERFGISVTFELIGTVTGIVIWACAFIIPSNPPDSFLEHKSSARESSWSQMIREPIFLFMFFSLFAGSFSGMLIASQATNITKELIGTNLTIGALIVSLFALSNTIEIGRAHV